MGYESIHETVVADILETIKDGVHLVDGVVKPKSANVRMSSSLARATSGLTLVFPVVITNTLPIETASMIAKAIERKNVSMLQMAFSAYNITNAPDALEHLAKFHKNLKLGHMSLDDFMDTMEMLDESTTITITDKNAVNEDCKRNINFVLKPSINEKSLMSFKESTVYGQTYVTEAKPGKISDDMAARLAQDQIKHNEDLDEKKRQFNLNRLDRQTNWRADYDERVRNRLDRQANWRADYDERVRNRMSNDALNRDKNDIARAKNDIDRDKLGLDSRKALGQASDQMRQYYASQLLPSDVKKANEMQPSMMLVNFYVNDADRDLNIAQQAVCGVKSKLYAVDSSDIINKIITKHIDSDIVLKLVKVSSREISFVKDFLLGIDDAKLDSLSKSRKGSGSRIFKALERRALKGKIRKSLRLENSAKAITSLVISSEEAEDLKKYNNIDVMQPRVITPIMEKLNLLYFLVVDSTSEAVHMITDGDDEFESYSFTALERESGDSSYKKVINLMTKIAR